MFHWVEAIKKHKTLKFRVSAWIRYVFCLDSDVAPLNNQSIFTLTEQ